MKLTKVFSVVAVALACLSTGCGTEDVPPAHTGMMFDRTGPLAFYSGGKGFTGDVLKPGTYYTGIYPELRTIECSQVTKKETMDALTKDGVQFKIDMYVRYAAQCDNKSAVGAIFDRVAPDKGHTITAEQLYGTFLKPALSEAVRAAVSPHIANSINAQRDAIFAQTRAAFDAAVAKQTPPLIQVLDANMSNLDFPDAMDQANTERAVQDVLKDKAVAERARVDAEIETAKSRKKLAEADGETEAARINAIGRALRDNPAYVEYRLQTLLPDIYAKAGEKGNMVLAAPVPINLNRPGGGKLPDGSGGARVRNDLGIGVLFGGSRGGRDRVPLGHRKQTRAVGTREQVG